jgi:hypothetical protein
MPSRDVSQEAPRQVRDATDDCEPATTEELRAFPKLRRQLREPQEGLKPEPRKPDN